MCKIIHTTTDFISRNVDVKYESINFNQTKDQKLIKK